MNEEAIVPQTCEFCIKVHVGQTRDDSKPYATHSTDVARIRAELQQALQGYPHAAQVDAS